MNYINLAYGTLVTLIIFIVLTRFWMEIVNYMGGKGKRYPEEFKRKIFKKVEETGNTALVASRHDLVPCTVESQRKKMD
jgi:hypothetical protein